MNIVSRGIRNAFRNTIRTGSIIAILALSIGLIIAMLAARQAVNDKIQTVKASSGNTITISPAGVRGFEGGGEALTTDELAKVSSADHVTKVVETLNDRLSTDDTSLVSSIEAGSLGRRNAESSGSTSTASGESSSTMPQMPGGDFMSRIEITGTNDVSSIRTSSTSLTWTSGEMFDSSSTEQVAVLGKAIAEKNSLSVGSTFTAYGTTFKVVGIYDAGNTFANNGVYIPLSTLQTLSDQAGSVTSAIATVDSSDNLASAPPANKSILGDKADITNSQDAADATAKPLESVATIALFSLIGALVAGAVIILLTMLMIVRERRREIGVMKAIGASNLSIMWQFVVESLTLTLAGLVVGALIGVAAATPLTNALVDNSTSTTSTTRNERGIGGPGGNFGSAVRNFREAGAATVENIQASVGSTTLLYGIGAALLIAILGSALPSLMISKVKPADAMRNE